MDTTTQEQHENQKRALILAAQLCVVTNACGDGHDVSGKGCMAAHTIVRLAWFALGCPPAAIVDAMCKGAVDGWDGCDNAGFDFITRNDDGAGY